ncbi:MAG: asparagine synthase-related protein [Candidatus Diapherotrites archaeon]
MASISFISSKKKKPVSFELLDFLYSQKHRGFDLFEIIFDEGKKEIKLSANSLHELTEKINSEKIKFTEALGFGFFNSQLNEFKSCGFKALNFLEGNLNEFRLDGEIFNEGAFSLLKNLNKSNIHLNLKKFISSARGEFAGAVKLNNSFYFFRDFLGGKPLWFGENSLYFAVASELRALRKLNIAFPQKLKAGHLLEFNGKKFSEKKLFDFSDLHEFEKQKTNLNELIDSLIDSVSIRTKNLRNAGIYFSGGVDSALIAKLVSEKVKKTVLLSAGFEGAQDLEFAKKSAKEMNLDLEIIYLQEKEIPEKVFSTLKTLYLFDEMQLQIALPEFVLAEYCAKNKISTVFSGQGSDELFCGYSEFKSALKESNFKGVQEKIYWFLESMDGRNFYREDMISSKFGLNLRAPLLDLEFVKKAVAFPAKEKIYSFSDELRKHPIREIAKKFGVPKISFERKKKAMQYGSMSSKYRNYLK